MGARPTTEEQREYGRRFKADMLKARRATGLSISEMACSMGLDANGAAALWYVENKCLIPCNSKYFARICNFLNLNPSDYGDAKPAKRTNLGYKFSLAVKSARHELGLSRNELIAMMPELTLGTLANIEHRTKVPRRCRCFLSICDALGLNPKDYGG